MNYAYYFWERKVCNNILSSFCDCVIPVLYRKSSSPPHTMMVFLNTKPLGMISIDSLKPIQEKSVHSWWDQSWVHHCLPHIIVLRIKQKNHWILRNRYFVYEKSFRPTMLISWVLGSARSNHTSISYDNKMQTDKYDQTSPCFSHSICIYIYLTLIDTATPSTWHLQVISVCLHKTWKWYDMLQDLSISFQHWCNC